MPKITVSIYEKRLQYFFTCPACKEGHMINDTWKFNKDFNQPSIKPSINVTGVYKNDEGVIIKSICHSVITNGFINFQDDCTHNLKGQTVELPERERGK